MARRVGRSGAPVFHPPAGRQVAIDEVVRAGLVGHQVGPHAAGLRAPDQLGQHLGGIAKQRDRDRLAGFGVPLQARQRVVDVGGLLIDVAGAQAKVDAALLAFHRQRAGAGQRGRQRLRAAHATQAGREDPFALPAAGVMLASRFDEGLEGALHDALAADVDPAAGSHLAVHEQALAVEFVEVLPVGPLGHQVAVGQQHARRIGVGAEHPDRFAGLDEQRLVVAQVLQRCQDGVEAGPVACRTANAAVHHQRLGVLGHVRVEVVLQHAERRLGQPALAVQFSATWRADFARGVVAGVGQGSRG